MLSVTQSVMPVPYAVQDATSNWGLDRLDSVTPDRNNAYSYTKTGAGRTIWILDSGLALSNANVAAEFGGRASIFYDWYNSVPYGDDCYGHGTEVASVAGGNTLGAAKGVTLKIVKITNWNIPNGGACGTPPSGVDTIWQSLNWLATPGNASRGSIVNLSFGHSNSFTCASYIDPNYDNVVKQMVNGAGLIVVESAGNFGCNVANFSMTHLPEVFVVGGTSGNALSLLGGHYDALYSKGGYSTNTGVNVSAFAPAQDVSVMTKDGLTVTNSGTSLAAPYIAGMFAVGCEAYGTYCDITPVAAIYTEMRNKGVFDTVRNADGTTPLPNGSTSRFIWQQW